MIAARSRGLPAIALPGTDCWRSEWAPLFSGRHITIVMDADRQGRALAARIAGDLGDHAEAAVVELAPDREDGYDLTDWLQDNSSPGKISLDVFATSSKETTQKGHQ
jgi:hypothetical protein